jgi:putative ABC transport system ATP-binding protein
VSLHELRLVIEMLGISKHYTAGRVLTPVLRDVSLRIDRGEFVALTGPSGSGKTTLMNIMGLLDRPSSGSIRLDGLDVSRFTLEQGARLRNAAIGFVFQAFHLLPHLTALDNVALPLIYRGVVKAERRAIAARKLDRVGLGSFLLRHPAELSGGQRQRVAVARALAGDPRLLLADEPTGNLDSRAAAEIMNLFVEIRNELHVTVVLVTHDVEIAARCPRRILLRDGVLQEDQRAFDHAPENAV